LDAASKIASEPIGEFIEGLLPEVASEAAQSYWSLRVISVAGAGRSIRMTIL
jgi:hypothetical protein